VATLAEPEHRFAFFNEHYQTITNNRAQLGRPVAEALFNGPITPSES
jgi:hypothetical protein